MTDDVRTSGNTSSESEEDPYAPVLRSLPRDLLININGSDSREVEIPEMTVASVDEDGPVVHLNAGEDWGKIIPNPDAPGFVYVDIDDEGRRRNWTDVLTLEVIGYA